MTEPETILTLEAPAGLIQARATCRDGRVERVRITNVPSFADRLAVPLDVAGVGTLTVDTAYGGDSFVIVDAPSLGFDIVHDEARDIAEMGVRITKAANEQLGFHHPENPDWDHISFCQIAAPVIEVGGIKTGRNAVVVQPGKIDRSPTGTGCSARLAVMRARNEIEIGEAFTGVSIISSEFHCKIESETTVGGKAAVVPSLSGRGFVTGTHQHMLDPNDPWPNGYRLSDTWPKLL